MTTVVALLLGIAVVCALIGAVAFHRLATPLERLHAGAFGATAAGAAIVVAAFLTEGITGRAIKVLALYAVLLVSGALCNHALARAIHLRGGDRR